MKILLDYVFPITVITPTPAASTGFLKRVCLVCKPKSGQGGNVGTMFTCNNMTQVAARTDNTNAQQLFNAGLTQVFILLANQLTLETAMETYKGEFFTLLISDDFDDVDVTAGTGVATPAVQAELVVGDLTFTAVPVGTLGNAVHVELLDDVTAGGEFVHESGGVISIHMEDGVSTADQIKAAFDDSVSALAKATCTVAAGQGSAAQAAAADAPLTGGTNEIAGALTGLQVGTFDGVIGVSSTDEAFCADQVTKTNRCAFFTGNGAKNMCFAFGSLLANPSNWLNQQYIAMPFDDGVSDLGSANSYFDDKVSFVIHDDEFGNRLALFAVQGKAIIAPYILKNLRIDLQSKSLQWISANQPQYTIAEAALLETRLQDDVIKLYVEDRKWIESGTVTIKLEEDNFVASGEIVVPQPKALWRVLGEMQETT